MPFLLSTGHHCEDPNYFLLFSPSRYLYRLERSCQASSSPGSTVLALSGSLVWQMLQSLNIYQTSDCFESLKEYFKILAAVSIPVMWWNSNFYCQCSCRGSARASELYSTLFPLLYPIISAYGHFICFQFWSELWALPTQDIRYPCQFLDQENAWPLLPSWQGEKEEPFVLLFISICILWNVLVEKAVWEVDVCRTLW